MFGTHEDFQLLPQHQQAHTGIAAAITLIVKLVQHRGFCRRLVKI